MELIDDLLEIGADDWGQQGEEALIESEAIERVVEIGRPLDETYGAADARVLREAEKHVLMAIARAVTETLGIDAIERSREFKYVVAPKHAADDGVSLFPVLLKVIACHTNLDQCNIPFTVTMHCAVPA